MNTKYYNAKLRELQLGYIVSRKPMIYDSTISATAYRTYNAMLGYYKVPPEYTHDSWLLNDDRRYVTVTMETLALTLNCSIPTIARAKQELVKAKYIYIKPLFHNGKKTRRVKIYFTGLSLVPSYMATIELQAQLSGNSHNDDTASAIGDSTNDTPNDDDMPPSATGDIPNDDDDTIAGDTPNDTTLDDNLDDTTKEMIQALMAIYSIKELQPNQVDTFIKVAIDIQRYYKVTPYQVSKFNEVWPSHLALPNIATKLLQHISKVASIEQQVNEYRGKIDAGMFARLESKKMALAGNGIGNGIGQVSETIIASIRRKTVGYDDDDTLQEIETSELY